MEATSREAQHRSIWCQQAQQAHRRVVRISEAIWWWIVLGSCTSAQQVGHPAPGSRSSCSSHAAAASCTGCDTTRGSCRPQTAHRADASSWSALARPTTPYSCRPSYRSTRDRGQQQQHESGTGFSGHVERWPLGCCGGDRPRTARLRSAATTPTAEISPPKVRWQRFSQTSAAGTDPSRPKPSTHCAFPLLIPRNRPERRTSDARGRRSDWFVNRGQLHPEAYASRSCPIHSRFATNILWGTATSAN